MQDAGPGIKQVTSALDAGQIAARLDRLPATRTIWTLVALLSLGGFFEYYDLFFTGYIAPGLVRSHILTATTRGLFGTTGIASFAAAMFSGLFIGTALFGVLADRFGRRSIFTVSLLWYTAATVIMAFQNHVFGLNLWRFIAGIGVGVELVTIDTYVSELVPRGVRGRAFAFNQTIQFCAVPVVALLAWRLVPLAPLSLDGWRWVVLIGAASAVFVWWIRLRVPESPRWLAQHGRLDEAERVLEGLEASIAAETGRSLPDPVPAAQQPTHGNFRELWRAPYLRRTVMLSIFNLFQTVGFYGFSNWVPTLLIERGIEFTSSLEYTFLIAIAAPFGPLLAASIADKFERKWQIVMAALGVALSGLLFARMSLAPLLILFGVLLTLSNNIMSFSLHAYQAELYPTRVRALAIGFVYSWSRLSVVFSSFVIGFFLERFGVTGVFAFIAASMLIVMLSIGLFGPRTKNMPLEAISH
ncbi:MAG TPA: MFS transporter [Bryobacteraceae bacterium]|nr:MFS transporter [Bryobacteraceae bacterium]